QAPPCRRGAGWAAAGQRRSAVGPQQTDAWRRREAVGGSAADPTNGRGTRPSRQPSHGRRVVAGAKHAPVRLGRVAGDSGAFATAWRKRRAGGRVVRGRAGSSEPVLRHQPPAQPAPPRARAAATPADRVL
ncbi:hypothetical protein LPJ70_001540, partial [Coemansia sp. RSA 2708]